ncbi:hypothetical protein FAES_2840 [Fibrella aestuarina BUZ 2]|uniref:DUF4932 domain-containing protein n=1 Tax=Fibrella aestuarina BUZ 2 TaxID=1166018 RepID=I0K9P6_9BACT|nr:DUF4932 domain-containing protein [Fibrella aestuarina]CCH00849.1 hypothetical protein FAES_2840 [Fibrella aestuarina BUZ 2]
MKSLVLTRLSVAIAMLVWAGFGSRVEAQPGPNPVRVSETYELANIILALTDYGKTDPWEVAQHSAYYKDVRAHFDPYAHHPLLTAVNYSREKWESYLSFRTDAYAFTFDANSRLVRAIDFHANKEFNPFEEQLNLIEDFVRTTGFRQFYRAHLPYYQRLATAYLASQRYDEMRHFLENEFGKRSELTAYAIVFSPLVGRMNCHRTVAGVGTDFITLPDFLLDGRAVNKATRAEIASSTHMLFTELDHAFVNPATAQHQALLAANFTASRWDMSSGYGRDSVGVFNEYMTWAVYDLYVQTYFPDVAATVSQDWALQNATRGFFASSAFNHELTRLYKARRPGQRLNDLYPAFIRRLGALTSSLSQPTITHCNLDKQTIADTVATLIIRFSEPMMADTSLNLVRAVEQAGKVVRQERVALTPATSDLRWTNDGTMLQVQVRLVANAINHLVLNYPWRTRTAFRSRNGVDLKPYSRISTRVSAGN